MAAIQAVREEWMTVPRERLQPCVSGKSSVDTKAERSAMLMKVEETETVETCLVLQSRGFQKGDMNTQLNMNLTCLEMKVNAVITSRQESERATERA